jgi:hypothetical protein
MRGVRRHGRGLIEREHAKAAAARIEKAIFDRTAGVGRAPQYSRPGP